MLGAFRLTLGYEPFERDSNDLVRDLALGVSLDEGCGDLGGRAGFLQFEEVAADELDQGGLGRLCGIC
ncbi:hypothetical protein KJK32_46395 (plasmid) [Streptomyces sp. JCM17656]|nr:hypothetical protein KJK32_46395 [Streptomyces sp. JCM17656]